ncbi:LysE family translocator [Amycolatopsis pigmentata]|uniref:LysE family translocator n=1 Tax=Amycolatopsis pigmentata TaxID=450801 RepID=A0ABW5FV57_9PSEU
MTNWVGFVPTALLVSLIPGANQLLGLSNAARYGAAHALAGIGGRLAAFVALIALVVAGLGTMLAASATVLTVIKWAGVVYLLWIGIAGLRQAWRRRDVSGAAGGPRGGKGPWALAVNEFVVAMGNPKALLLFAALLPQFTSSGHGLALLGAAYLGVEFVVGLGYVAIGSGIGATGMSIRTQRRVDLGVGICFVTLAGLLAAD